MTRYPGFIRYLPTLFAAVCIAGCGWFGGDSPLSSDDTLLRYVPADTPYIVASVEPMPDEFAELYAEQVASAWEMMRSAMQNLLTTAAPGGPDRETVEMINELISPEMLERTGMSRESTSLLYGYGLLPVFRATLGEGHDFNGVLDNIESLLERQSQLVIETASIDGQNYRYLLADQARIIAAVLENEFVLTVAPVSFDDAELASILGLELPDRSIADSGRLQDIADEYGYTANLIAMFDAERIAATFLDQPNATDAKLLDLAGFDGQMISAACRNEYRDLAGVAPRIVSGYTEISQENMAMSMVVELREDIAAGLAAIPAAVPGMGAATTAMMSFGMSFDIPAMRAFANARLDALEADPFECEALADLAAVVPMARMNLNQPLPPLVDGLHGFSAMLDIGDLNLANLQSLPSDLDLAVLIATDDAAGVVSMASMFDPELAALNLGTDGQIVELSLPAGITGPGSNPFGSMYIAATESSLAVGMGSNARANLERLMAAPAGDTSSFFSMSVDTARYYGLMADALESVNAGSLAAQGAAVPQLASMSEMMRSLQDIYSREYVDVRFTERGIEMPVRLELKQ